MQEPQRVRGAYGLVLGGEFPAEMLVEAGPGWLPWRFESHVLNAPHELVDDDFHITGSFARIPYQSDGYVEIDRDTSTTRVYLDHLLSPAEMVHPTPVGTAALNAWWHGRQALHGTAVGRGDRAVAFLGAQEQGKSTTAMHLVRAGWGLVSDDLLVVDGTRVMSGPRSLDLRVASAEAMGAGTYIGRVGLRERWRETTAAAAPEHTLVGLVELEWGDRFAVERLDLKDRLAALARHRTIPMLPPLDAAAVLSTLAVPVLRVTRPHGLEHLDAAVDAVMADLGVSDWSAPPGLSDPEPLRP